MFITGLFTLKAKPMAFVIANVMLCFFILMDITIAWLSIKMNQATTGSGAWVTIVMAVLAFISLVLFYLNTTEAVIKRDPVEQAQHHHLHPGAPHSH
jgi:hypothetical protein